MHRLLRKSARSTPRFHAGASQASMFCIHSWTFSNGAWVVAPKQIDRRRRQCLQRCLVRSRSPSTAGRRWEGSLHQRHGAER